MASYIFKKVSNSVHQIRYRRKVVGTITATDEGYSASVRHPTDHRRRIRATATTPDEAFDSVVRSLNRIHLCGEDDADKATAALQARNDEALQTADQYPGLVRVKRSKVLI